MRRCNGSSPAQATMIAFAAECEEMDRDLGRRVSGEAVCAAFLPGELMDFWCRFVRDRFLAGER